MHNSLCDAAGPDGMGFIFTWLRMSSSKILTWARRSNYQSKDIAWMQKVTSERMTDKVRRFSISVCAGFRAAARGFG